MEPLHWCYEGGNNNFRIHGKEKGRLSASVRVRNGSELQPGLPAAVSLPWVCFGGSATRLRDGGTWAGGGGRGVSGAVYKYHENKSAL